MAQIYLYKLLFFSIFLATGYETFSVQRIIKVAMPFWGFSNGFTSCFIVFFRTIPFLSILVQNMNKRQHELLLLLTLGIYTILGSIPSFDVRFNYITWFGIIFFIASYFRFYPQPLFERKNLWGWMTLLCIFLAIVSILGLRMLKGTKTTMGYDFVADSNKILAVAVAVCSFLWFKNLNMKYSKWINSIGAATFGVLLIHANSDSMRTWLWRDTVDVCGHYFSMSTGGVILYSIGVVLAIFIICNLIDQLRIATLEKWLFRWYDNKVAAKADVIISKFTKY